MPRWATIILTIFAGLIAIKLTLVALWFSILGISAIAEAVSKFFQKARKQVAA